MLKSKIPILLIVISFLSCGSLPIRYPDELKKKTITSKLHVAQIYGAFLNGKMGMIDRLYIKNTGKDKLMINRNYSAIFLNSK